MARHPRILLGVIFLFCFSLTKASVALAADEVKVTTYYPAPWGEYTEVRAKKAVMGTVAGPAIDPADTLTVYGDIQVNSNVDIGRTGTNAHLRLNGQEILPGAGAVKFNEGNLTSPAGGWIPFSRPYAAKPMLFLQIEFGVNDLADAQIVGPSHALPVFVIWRDAYNSGCQITELTPNGFRYVGVGTWPGSIYWVAVGG